MLRSDRSSRSTATPTTLARKGLLLAATAAAAGALTFSTAASAQVDEPAIPDSNGNGMDTHLFRSAVDSKGLISVNGSDVLGAWDFSFGMVLDWGHKIMRTDPNAGVRAESFVSNSLQGNFMFNLGIANWASIGVSAPLDLITSDGAIGVGPTGETYNNRGVDFQMFAGIAFHGKLRLTRIDDGVGIALLAQGGVPFDDSPRDFGNDPGFWYWPQLIIDHRFGTPTSGVKIATQTAIPQPSLDSPRPAAARFRSSPKVTSNTEISLPALSAPASASSPSSTSCSRPT